MLILLALAAAWPNVSWASEGALAAGLGAQLPEIAVTPFVLLLLAIAVLPLAAGHWWEHNRNKGIIAAVLSAPIVIYLLTTSGAEGQHALIEKVIEYISFIALLGALFVISGGIYVKGSLSGTTLVNTSVLGFGAVLANLIGTTGASVVLIRPLLRANSPRQRKAHIVIFFIFIVSNCGGLLTPLGDPPLFLGFLKGVPFEWTFNLWKPWLVVNGMLLVIFHIWDQVVFDKEERERAGSQLEQVMQHEPLRVTGLHNFLFLAGVVLTILASGKGWLNDGHKWHDLVQAAVMIGLAVVGYLATPAAIRTGNKFTFGPIIEVAVLFAGIFITMTPALLILNAWGEGHRDVLGLTFRMKDAWEYFWATGVLSSFLDNAPTYMTFAATACGTEQVSTSGGQYLSEFLSKGPEAASLLAAISCGAVFMGANTYIGNGPNFMVKAIAEENGVKMPGFFGYMAYSGAILIPLFGVVTWLFFV
jgi:Na+/H+ antiporter NhaD/arsenite permease-like protein